MAPRQLRYALGEWSRRVEDPLSAVREVLVSLSGHPGAHDLGRLCGREDTFHRLLPAIDSVASAARSNRVRERLPREAVFPIEVFIAGEESARLLGRRAKLEALARNEAAVKRRARRHHPHHPR